MTGLIVAGLIVGSVSVSLVVYLARWLDTGRRPGGRWWWAQAGLLVGFYAVYSLVRDAGPTASTSRALTDARAVVWVERHLWVYRERGAQRWALAHLPPGVMQAADVFYGSAHFVVTMGLLLWLYRRRPSVYPYWRNVLMAATAAAVVGFWLFPLMPPRLLPGGGFVDTLARLGGGPISTREAFSTLSNQYAAMPSLHTAWATWVAFAARDARLPRWGRWAAVAHAAATYAVVVVTANHYLLDVAVGDLLLWAGVLAVTRWTRARRHLTPTLAA